MPDTTRHWQATIGGARVRFGAGRAGELAAVVTALGSGRPLLVTDPGVRAAGHVEPALERLRQAGLEVAVFDRVPENPSGADVERGAGAAREHRADLLVALGGGSALDTAKGINLLATNGGRMVDYRGWNETVRPLLPSVGVPTTAGTGSEAQSYAVIADPDTGDKMACGAPGAGFREVLLDPGLLATLPRRVAATAALDAVSHAVESYVTTSRNPVSVLYAGEAWRLLDGAFEAFLADLADGGAAGRMLLGAHLAGAAVEQSMLGAAHAAANPLTARYGTVHGAAVLLMLPVVVRFNAPAAAALYARLAGDGAGPDPAAALARRLEALRAEGGLPGSLRECGVEHDRLPELARLAAAQWTGRYNPRPVGEAEFRDLYEAAY